VVARRAGTSLDVIADIVQQGLQIKATGDDATAYRVSIQMPPTTSQTAFVVKEDGNYRLLSYADWGVPVATEAVDILVTIVASVGIAALATLYPSMQAARLYPIEAIRHE